MKRIFLGAVLSLFAMVQSFAGDIFTVNGINYEITGNTTCQVAKNKGISGSIVILETVNYEGKTYTVTSIGDYAFQDCYGLTSVVISNSVVSIGKFAFGH